MPCVFCLLTLVLTHFTETHSEGRSVNILVHRMYTVTQTLNCVLVDIQRQLTHLHASLHMSPCALQCVCSDIDDLNMLVPHDLSSSSQANHSIWCVLRTLVTDHLQTKIIRN